MPPHTPACVWPAVLIKKEPQKKVRWAVGGAFTTRQPPDLEQVPLSLAFPSWRNWAGTGQGAGQRALHHMRALDKALWRWLTLGCGCLRFTGQPAQQGAQHLSSVAGVLVAEVNK